MNRDRLFPFVVSLAIGTTVCVALSAQEPPYGETAGPSSGDAALSNYGTLVSIGTASIVLREDDGQTTTFSVDEKTSLPTVMTSGDRIGVEYEALDGGGHRASRLTVLETDRQAAVTLGGAAVMKQGDEDQGYDTAPEPDDRLPATAGPLPLLALAGALSITTAAGLRLLGLRRRPRS